jgi:hypothetical protein
VKKRYTYQTGGEQEQSWMDLIGSYIPAIPEYYNKIVNYFDEPDNFNEAFARARAAGEPTFTFDGKLFNTAIKKQAAAPKIKAGSLESNELFPSELLLRQAFMESRFKPSVVSGKERSRVGAMGLAQLMPDTIESYKKATSDTDFDPFNPEDSAKAQKWFMKWLSERPYLNKPGQSIDVTRAKILGAYNWGPGNMKTFLEGQKAKGVDIYNSLDWVENLDEEPRKYIQGILLNQLPSFQQEIERDTVNSPYNKHFGYKKSGGEAINPLAQLYNQLNPYNWGVADYTGKGNFNTAYRSAKKAGEKEFIWNDKRYTTKYAGTPRQEVGAYGVDGRPVNSKDIDNPAQVNLYPVFGKYLPGHISASIGGYRGTSVDYGPTGNWRFGLGKVKNKGEKSFNVYGQDNLTFNDKVANLPTGDFMVEDEFTPSDWNLFINNCADNVCDALGIPRRKGLETPTNALSKIREKYPTLETTGRNQYDYENLVSSIDNRGSSMYLGKGLSHQEFVKAKTQNTLKNINKLLSVYYSPDTKDVYKKEIGLLVQRALENSGYSLPKSNKSDGQLDGIIGKETEQALENWKNKNKMQKGGLLKRQVGIKTPTEATYNAKTDTYDSRYSLPEITVTGKAPRDSWGRRMTPEQIAFNNKIHEAQGKALSELMGNTVGLPQRVMMSALSHHNQMPSEAWGYEDPKGFWENAVNIGMDIAIDPFVLGSLGTAGTKAAARGIAKNVGRGFKSEIDWAKWNPEIPSNKILMDEYRTIEQASKAKGTWMKNLDGSKFTGTPEQFVQQNSQNFKKVFSEGFGDTYRGVQFENPLLINNPKFKSVFTANKDLAKKYARNKEELLKQLYYKKSKNNLELEGLGQDWGDLRIRTPEEALGQIDYDLQIVKHPETVTNLNEAKKRLLLYNDDYKNKITDFISKIRAEKGKYAKTSTDEIANFLEKYNIDNVNIRNIIDGSTGDVRIINHVPNNYLKSMIGNNGMFDMTNPNIYKKKGGPILSSRGQWDYPGEDTVVPTPDGRITMQGVPYLVYGQDETGYGQIMYPGAEYIFPGQMVYETPMMQGGGESYKEWKEKYGLSESPDYNLKRAWKLGYTPNSEGHLPTVDFKTGKFLKSRNHPTIGLELEWFNSPDAEEFRQGHRIDSTGRYFKYVPVEPVMEQGGLLQNFYKQNLMKNGGQMIRRADGSYSQRGLWDNIRANKGSGKKPTKEMLEQERKIKAKNK